MPDPCLTHHERRNPRANRLLVRAAIVIALGTLAFDVHAADRVYTIQDFTPAANNLEGHEVTVEGRVSVLSPDFIRFRNCPFSFRTEGKTPVLFRKSSNVEVTGTVLRDERNIISMKVKSAREAPSDLELFQQRRRLVRLEVPEDWYNLADWARRRGEFYKDQELLARADDLVLRAFALERQRAAGNAADLLKLADKVPALQLAETIRTELIHEHYRLRWATLKQTPVKEWDAFRAELAQKLPGSTDPLHTRRPDLVQAYAEKPLETYVAADDATRKLLHRLFYSEVLLPQITTQLKTDHSNGFALAEQLDRQLPEQHALAESYRDKALSRRAQEVEKMTRPEVLAFAEQYRQRQQPQLAEQTIETWLTLRQRRLERDDVEGWLVLSDEYRALLTRHDRADRLLLDAYQKHPQAKEITERLERRGYRLVAGSWLTAAQIQARPVNPLDQALREGRIEKGMSGQQVRQSLGSPTSQCRAATAGQITELWTYGQGSGQIVVHLTKRRDQKELKVAAVVNAAVAP